MKKITLVLLIVLFSMPFATHAATITKQDVQIVVPQLVTSLSTLNTTIVSIELRQAQENVALRQMGFTLGQVNQTVAQVSPMLTSNDINQLFVSIQGVSAYVSNLQKGRDDTARKLNAIVNTLTSIVQLLSTVK